MDLEDVKGKMQKVVDHTKSEVATIRTGRANPSIVENLVVDVYGGTTKMRIMEVATITVPEPTVIVLAPYDTSIIGDIRKGVEAANIGVNPVIDNNIIRLTFPPLTSERRLEFVKMLHVRLEDGRVKLRQTRHDVMTHLKRSFEDKEITEDDRKRDENELQKVMDKFMETLEEIGKAKEADLMVL
ncbi:MAG: ribosome recycling factor [Patescibacteria group bacterium]